MLDPKVECTGEGVWFVEAKANCSLKDINYLQHPTVLTEKDVSPFTKLEIDEADTIAMIQITEFECGGFVVGIRTNHAILDGLGVAQFIFAVSELARGLLKPTVMPIWARDDYPNPNFKPATIQPLPKMSLEYIEVDFPVDYIKNLKRQFIEYVGRHCSTFDLIAAKAWQCYVKATNLKLDLKIRMVFFSNTRDILKINKGYYGNSVYPAEVEAISGQIASCSVFEIVNLIIKVKERIIIDALAWANGELMHDPTFTIDTFVISDLTKLGFEDVNYGWGTPLYWRQFLKCDLPRSCNFVRSPAPLHAIKVIAACVTKEHIDSFQELLNDHGY